MALNRGRPDAARTRGATARAPSNTAAARSNSSRVEQHRGRPDAARTRGATARAPSNTAARGRPVAARTRGATARAPSNAAAGPTPRGPAAGPTPRGPAGQQLAPRTTARPLLAPRTVRNVAISGNSWIPVIYRAARTRGPCWAGPACRRAGRGRRRRQGALKETRTRPSGSAVTASWAKGGRRR